MKRTLVLLSLSLLIGAGLVAQTAVTYQITSTPTFVINVGRSEIVGNVRFTALNGAAVASINSTIDVLYLGLGCDNTASALLGVRLLSFPVQGTAGTLGASAITVTSPVNSSTGCVVSVNVPAVVVAVGDFIEVQGVRGRIDLSPASAPGVDVSAALNATPAGSSLFTSPTVVRVATSSLARTFTPTARTYLTCAALALNPIITVAEVFNGAFVQHTAAPVSANQRTPNGQSSNNTRVQFVIAGIPTGITLTWPLVVANGGAGAVGSSLNRISASSTSTTQLYDYQTPDQGMSDVQIESFAVIPVVTITAGLPLGTVTFQANLQPGLATGDATSVASAVTLAGVVQSRPRFNDPLEAARTLFTINPCATNLLYPYVTFDAMSGFDTGISVANTSTDPFGSLGGAGVTTPAQSGSCTLYGYPAAGGAAVVATVPAGGSLPSGQTYAAPLSTITGFTTGFTGYIIARCNFQYAHGIGFITDGFGRPAPATSSNYVALIIPDPLILGTPRGANSCGGIVGSVGFAALNVNGTGTLACVANTGEGLGH